MGFASMIALGTWQISRLNTRISVLESQHSGLNDTMKSISEKLDHMDGQLTSLLGILKGKGVIQNGSK